MFGSQGSTHIVQLGVLIMYQFNSGMFQIVPSIRAKRKAQLLQYLPKLVVAQSDRSSKSCCSTAA